MASGRKRRVEHASATTLNERLIEATLQLLREAVPADLTLRRIATAAGTTTMALYTGFGSRDGLLDVVYARGFEQLGECMAPATLLADPEQAVVELLSAYRAFALANPGLYGLLFERVLPGFDPSPGGPQHRARHHVRPSHDPGWALAGGGRAGCRSPRARLPALGADPRLGDTGAFAHQPKSANPPRVGPDQRPGRPGQGAAGGNLRLEPDQHIDRRSRLTPAASWSPVAAQPPHVDPASADCADQPHTSAAVSTISASFAICSSTVRSLPSTVEENPHCPDRQSCSSGTYFAASSMRRLRSSLLSSSRSLRRDQTEHDLLARRHEAQRLEAAGALVVVLEEEPVDVELAEQRLGDEVVAALGRPRRAEVAAAQVRRDVQAGRPVGDRGVDLADVALVLVLGVAALARRARRAAPGRSGRRGWCRRAAGRCSRARRAAHLARVGRRQVGPELVLVGIDARIDGAPAAAVVHHARRRDGQLRRRRRDASTAGTRRRSPKIGVGRAPIRPSTLSAADVKSRSPAALRKCTASLLVGRGRSPPQLVDEVHVPGRAAELAVGRRPQARSPPACATTSRIAASSTARSSSAVDRAGRPLRRARRAAPAAAAGCRRGRRGTAVRCGEP